MNYLIIGYLNDIALGYLSVYTKNKKLKFICIDEKEPNEYSSFGLEEIKYYHEKVTIESIKKIFAENFIDKVINFYELNEPGHTLEEYNKENYTFVVDLYKLCKSFFIKQFVHISTEKLYGSSKVTYSSEDHKVYSYDHYTASKLNADIFLTRQKDVAIVRIGNTFGILYEDSLLNRLIKGILEDKPLYVHENVNYIRNYMDSKDSAFFLHKVLEKYKSGIYNITSEYQLTAQNLIDIFLEVTETTKEIIYTNTIPVKLESIKMDNVKMTSEVDYFIEEQKEKLKFYLKQFRGL